MPTLTLYFATEKRCTIAALQAIAADLVGLCDRWTFWSYLPDSFTLTCPSLDFYIPLYELQTLSQMQAIVWHASNFSTMALVKEMCDALEDIADTGAIVNPIHGDRLPARQRFLAKIGYYKSISNLETLLVTPT